MEYITHSPEETEALGAEYAKSLKAGDVVAFSGDLGAGKTAFTRGVLHGLGYEGRVTSPTFAIANEYETPTVKVAHFDLYRILDSEALFEIGFDEYLDGSRIVLIEWSENAADVLPEAYKTVHIAYGNADNDRRITIGTGILGGQRVCRAHRGRKTGGAVLSELRPDALAHAAADGGKPAGKLRRITR